MTRLTGQVAARVVVIDDSPLMRELLRAALTESGDIDVVGDAANPNCARRVIGAANPNVITLDAELPGAGGLEILRRITRLRPVPVVVVTGGTRASAETALAAQELGAVDFVAKPFGRAGWIDFAASLRHKVREAAATRVTRRAVPQTRTQ